MVEYAKLLERIVIHINLKYFTDKDNNYIIYRKFTDTNPNKYIQSSFFITRDTILPTNNDTAIESTFDKLAQQCIKKQLEKFSNCTEEDFSYIKIIGNFIDVDEINPVFAKNILNKTDIDKLNTKYRFGVRIESHYPVTVKSLLKNPRVVIKTIVQTTIAQLNQCLR